MLARRHALFAPCLSALAPLVGRAGSAGVRTLSFWTMQLSPHLDAYVRGLIRAYEAQRSGVRIHWVDLPWSEMERKVLTAIAAKQAPDVVNLNPQFAAKLAEFDALAVPEQHLGAEVPARYLPAAWAANRLDGKTFALPWYLTTNLTLFNRPLLERAGLPQAPRQHAELLAQAPRLRAAGAFAYFPALDGSHPLETLVAMGAPLLAPQGCGPGFINAQGAAVLGFYRQLYQQGLVPRNVVTEGHRKAVELFVAGELGLVSTGMQFLNFIRNSNAGLFEKIDIAAPLGNAGVPPNLAVMNLAVPQASSQRELAFDFAAFVSNADNQLAFARTVPVLPSTRASFADPFLSTTPASPALIDRARALSCATAQQGAVLVPPLRAYSKLRNSFTLQLQAQMLGKTAPDAALKQIGREWRALMRCAS
ncbi:extracellular solute-binding protein [Inhella sp.]|uniref:extracellular solute-binding protein n=1 Tax=Inhella sp. TaxID=1921806 RepID=UPI0035B3339A